MYALLIACLIAAPSILDPGPDARVQEAGAQSAPAPAAAPIAVKQTDPIRVVFMEHAGPYWTVGPLLTRVREYMLKHGRSGPMFARYLANPMTAAPSSLRTEIGFIVGADHQPEPPFKTARRGPELVAYLVVDGRSATTRHDYAAIHDWIQRHGYHAAGPITEIYDPIPPGSPAGTQRAEIQVSLVGAVRELPSRGSGAETPEAATSGEDAGPTTAEMPGAATAEQSEVQPPPGKAEPIQPVAELIAAEQFDRIARQLMPDDRTIPAKLEIWFGQVVFRIGAVAKGIKHVYPGKERIVAAMADAITRRYKRVSSKFTSDPLAQAVVRIDVRSDPLADRKRAIMRNLDTLLGRIALHSVDADAAVVELADVVQRVQDLMETKRRPEAKEREPPRSATP